MIFKYLLRFIFAGIFIISIPLSAIEKNNVDERLVNRKVLILDFVNSRNSADYSYLESSIPDSFLDPLDRTKSFELLPRSIWQNFLSENKFKKEDAYKENSAIDAGKFAGADVVIIGSFAALGDRMQIFAKALELSSGRVIVSRTSSAPLDNTMFDAISRLTQQMSEQMKEKLPPLPQKVITIEREKYITIVKDARRNAGPPVPAGITYGGQIWRTLLIPGLGHVYAGQWRGWVYMPLWAGSVGTLVYGIIDYNAKQALYLSATSGLEVAYAEANNAMFVRNISFLAVVGIYAVTLADTLIFGKGYERSAVLNTRDLSFYAMLMPELSSNKQEEKFFRGDFYVQFGSEKKF